jgi:hypothetical protein
LGVLQPPLTSQTIFFLKKIDLAIGGGQSTTKGHGVVSNTPIRPFWGGRSHPHGPWGCFGHPKGHLKSNKKKKKFIFIF